MTSKEALKRLKQETAPATYMPDFDKEKCIEIIKKDLEQLKELRKNHAKLLVQTAHLEEENETLEKENQKLKEQVDYYKKEMESEQDFRENLQIDLIEFVGAIKILKEVVTITKRRNEVNGNYDISCIYALVSYKDIIEEEYELLKEVLEDE